MAKIGLSGRPMKGSMLPFIMVQRGDLPPPFPSEGIFALDITLDRQGNPSTATFLLLGSYALSSSRW